MEKVYFLQCKHILLFQYPHTCICMYIYTYVYIYIWIPNLGISTWPVAERHLTTIPDLQWTPGPNKHYVSTISQANEQCWGLYFESYCGKGVRMSFLSMMFETLGSPFVNSQGLSKSLPVTLYCSQLQPLLKRK